MASEHYDVIIIGTGAGGGTMAHKLAPSGKRILVLERGGYLPREPENWSSEEVFGKGRYLPDEDWIDDHDGEPFKPHQQYFVGGNTKFYGAILFRLRERDFEQVNHYGGVSPAWPYSYADIEPYYTEAEKLYLVHGEAGEDPTEPFRSAPFPHPAVSHEPRIQQLADDFARTGHNPFHLPVGIDLDENDPEAGNCVRCDRFDGFPCLADGKADAHVLCIRPAIKHDNVTLRTHARVEKLVTDPSGGTIKEVVVDRRGARESYSADVVVVSCGAINSAALLLRSASDQHPNGLANSSDVVGRNYMAHINSGVIAVSQTPNTTKFQKTLGVNDYYWRADVRAEAGARLPGEARDRLLAHERGPAEPDEPGNGRPLRSDPRVQAVLQPRGAQAAAAEVEGAARRAGVPGESDPRPLRARPAHPTGRRGAPERNRALRRRPCQLGARRQLQGARAGQPVRGRHELLPVVERGQPGAHGDGELAARGRPPAGAAGRLGRHDRPGSQRQAGPRGRGGHGMNPVSNVASAVGKGLAAGLAGTAAMTISSTLEARIRGRAPSSAPARATAKMLGIKEFEDARAKARFNDLSHWGYGTSWGALRGLLAAAGLPPRRAPAAHGAAIYGAAQVTLPALEIAPPSVFWPKQEIAIDAFHHLVYATATGLAYELINGRTNG